MTIKELYEEAVAKEAEDYEIQLQYQDDGGCYYGSCTMKEIDYDKLKKEVTLA